MIPKLPYKYTWECECGRKLPPQVKACGDCEGRQE